MDILGCILLFVCFLFLPLLSETASISEGELLNLVKSHEKLINQLLNRVEKLENELLAERARTAALENSMEMVVRQMLQTTPNVAKSDDVNGSLLDNDSLKQPVSDVRQPQYRIRRAVNENPIAFFATMSKTAVHAGINQILVFDHVITNVGRGYNHYHGNFIAPVSGIYVFSVTVLSEYHNNVHLELIKNGQLVSKMYTSGAEAGHDTSSQTAILLLQQGDDIFIHNIDTDISIYGDHYSTFAGFLLQQIEGGTSVVIGK